MVEEILVDGNQGGSKQFIVLHRDRVGAAAREVVFSVNDLTGAVTFEKGVTFNGAVSPTLTGNSIVGAFSATTTITAGTDIISTAGVFKVGANQVVGARAAAVAAVATANADATYGQPEADLINELKAQLNDLLAKLVTHGLIAP